MQGCTARLVRATVVALAATSVGCKSAGGPSYVLEGPEVKAESFTQGKSPAIQCKAKFLEHLGWSFVQSTTARAEAPVWARAVCAAENLKAAQKSGGLSVAVAPADGVDGERAMEAQLDALIASDNSKCAQRIRLSRAVQGAAKKLVANKNFTFARVRHPGHDMAESEGIVGTSAKHLWEMESAKLSMYVRADQSPADALQALYDDRENTYVDCYAGALTLATLAQLELYTPVHFDQVFKPNSVFLGNVFTSASGIDGRGNPLDVTAWYEAEDYDEVPVPGWIPDFGGTQAMRLGRHALTARRGAIMSLLDERHLDSVNDVNENFVVTDVSADAEKLMFRLAEEGMDLREYVLRMSASAWLLQAQKRIEQAKRSSEAAPYQASMEELLAKYPQLKGLDYASWAARMGSDPIMNQMTLYVHPLGLKNIRQHVERLLGMNPRMPYGFEMRAENYSTLMYERYRDYFVKECR